MMKRSSSIIALSALGLGSLLLLRGRRQQPLLDIRNRVVLITGGSRGLGLVLARHLGYRGARLALVARDDYELRRAEDEMHTMGAVAKAFVCDIRDQQQVQDTVQRVVDHYGAIDILINNAGVIQVGPVEHMHIEDFENAIATHTYGPLYTILATIPHMRNRNGGHIVNIASVGGKVAVPHLLPYITSKFAFVGLSDGMRAELAQDDIKVTTVCPGLMRTGSHVNALFKGQHDKEFAWFSISDALPWSSMGAEEAAARIIDAFRQSKPHLTLTWQARFISAANELFPNATARLLTLANRALPDATDQDGNMSKVGWESWSKVAPSILTKPADHATVVNNQL
ncbi:MAG: SDR family NAD(P)-dependent oxidoreductase [Chloroflexota bacterium]